MENQELKKKIISIVMCILLMIGLIYLKVAFSSRQQFQQAEAAFNNKDYSLAVRHYERAILWYLPIGGSVQDAAKKLWHIAETLEPTDKKGALEAYRALRSGFYATRSFYTPGEDWIDRANVKIAHLMAEETLYSEEDRNKSLAQKTEEALAILNKPMKPDTFWSIALGIGFIGWVSGVSLFIWFAFKKEGTQLILRQSIKWGSVIIIFYALWIIGMARA